MRVSLVKDGVVSIVASDTLAQSVTAFGYCPVDNI